MQLTLDQASVIVDATIAKARAMKIQPICVAVLDEGGHLKALKREDHTGILRPQIAIGKAWGSLGMGASSRAIGDRLKDRPSFLAALSDMSGGKLVPVAGGVLIVNDTGIIGAVGVTGGTSDEDEACAISGIEKAGLRAKV